MTALAFAVLAAVSAPAVAAPTAESAFGAGVQAFDQLRSIRPVQLRHRHRGPIHRPGAYPYPAPHPTPGQPWCSQPVVWIDRLGGIYKDN